VEDKEVLATLERLLKDSYKVKNSVSKEEEITPETNILTYFDMDSLDQYEYIHQIETELKVSIPEEEAIGFETPRDFLDYLKKTNQI
jgi:acyl carrier protein